MELRHINWKVNIGHMKRSKPKKQRNSKNLLSLLTVLLNFLTILRTYDTRLDPVALEINTCYASVLKHFKSDLC